MTKLATEEIDDLIYACRTNDIEELSTLLKQQAEQHTVAEAEIIKIAIDEDEEGLGSRACLLHYPAANGNLELVNELLRRLNVTETDPEVQSRGQVNGNSNASSTVAGSTTVLANHQNVSGNTPLHWAALNGHLEVVKALVQAGADPTIVNEAGRDAMVEAEYSSKDGATECATWLLKECEALEQGANGVQAEEGATQRHTPVEGGADMNEEIDEQEQAPNGS